MHRHFQEYTFFKSQNFGLKKLRGLKNGKYRLKPQTKVEFAQICVVERSFVFFSCNYTCIIIIILCAGKESYVPHSSYQCYFFPELKLIHFFLALYKRLSLVSNFNFDPSRVRGCQRTRLVYLYWMLIHKTFPWFLLTLFFTTGWQNHKL